MKRLFKYITLTLVLLVGLSSCKTRFSELIRRQEEPHISKSDWRLRLVWNSEQLSSKLKIEASEGEGLYASLRPFPLLELGRLWFTPRRVVVLDLMNERYADLSYRELSLLFGRKLSYHTVEEAVLEEMKRLERNPDQELEGKTIFLSKDQTQFIHLDLLKFRKYSSSEDFHLKPLIKEDYERMNSRQLKFMLEFLFNRK